MHWHLDVAHERIVASFLSQIVHTQWGIHAITLTALIMLLVYNLVLFVPVN